MTVEIIAGAQLQVCEAQDVSAGGVRVAPVFPLPRGERVRLRLRCQRIQLEVSGFATVAWARRDPPYLAGLQFDEGLREEAGRFIVSALGPVRLVND